MSTTEIHHDFRTGAITGGMLTERIGMELMRISAFALAPLEFFGFSRAVGLISSIFRGNGKVLVKLADDSYFEYPYGDGYWATLLYHKLPYSPETEHCLKSFADVDYAFIDCGSNFGYISVLVSSEAFGNRPSIAIEADPENYQKTVRNCELNQNRFDHLHRAVFNVSGKTVSLYGEKHEALSLHTDNKQNAKTQVTSLALNDLGEWFSGTKCSKLILKLDIEGVEIEALNGAGALLDEEALVIYEEHGNDPSHTVSDHLKNNLGMKLFYGQDHGKRMVEILDLDQIDKLKTSKRIGYDMIATRSEFWINRLRNLSS